MIKPITITDFRKNTKTILDRVKSQDIYIARGWEVYKLSYESESQLDKKIAAASQPPPVAQAVGVLDKLKPKFCKNGHPIPYPKSTCMGKGCKYS